MNIPAVDNPFRTEKVGEVEGVEIFAMRYDGKVYLEAVGLLRSLGWKHPFECTSFQQKVVARIGGTGLMKVGDFVRWYEKSVKKGRGAQGRDVDTLKRVVRVVNHLFLKHQCREYATHRLRKAAKHEGDTLVCSRQAANIEKHSSAGSDVVVSFSVAKGSESALQVNINLKGSF